MTTPDNLVVMDIASGKTWSVLGRASTARSEFDELDWSPRGDLISFNRYDPSLDGQSFWVLPMDGATGHAAGGARRVTKHVGDRHAVSPDGQSIAFADYGPNGSQRIVVVAIKDGAERMLTGEREAISSVSWSDDGKWVYFSTEGRGPVHRVPSEGGLSETVSGNLRWATVFRPGPAIAVTETDGTVRVLDALSGSQPFVMPYSGRGTDRV